MFHDGLSSIRRGLFDMRPLREILAGGGGERLRAKESPSAGHAGDLVSNPGRHPHNDTSQANRASHLFASFGTLRRPSLRHDARRRIPSLLPYLYLLLASYCATCLLLAKFTLSFSFAAWLRVSACKTCVYGSTSLDEVYRIFLVHRCNG